MGFSRQEYWSGLPCPSPGDLPNPVIEARSPALQADSLPTELWGKPPPRAAPSFLLLLQVLSASGIYDSSPCISSDQDLLTSHSLILQMPGQGHPLKKSLPEHCSKIIPVASFLLSFLFLIFLPFACFSFSTEMLLSEMKVLLRVCVCFFFCFFTIMFPQALNLAYLCLPSIGMTTLKGTLDIYLIKE